MATREEDPFTHPPTRILNVYIKALTGFRPVYRPGGLNPTLLSQGCIFETSSYSGNWAEPDELQLGRLKRI